jgi:tRNA A37 N6-isopentenylltransferase MiaA
MAGPLHTGGTMTYAHTLTDRERLAVQAHALRTALNEIRVAITMETDDTARQRLTDAAGTAAAAYQSADRRFREIFNADAERAERTAQLARAALEG